MQNQKRVRLINRVGDLVYQGDKRKLFVCFWRNNFIMDVDGQHQVKNITNAVISIEENGYDMVFW